MSTIEQVTTSLRSARMRAMLPRVVFYGLAGILCLVGLRTILAGPVEPAPAAPPPLPAIDVGAEGFAESFTRVYLTWSSDDPDARERQLAGYLPKALSGDGGLAPSEGTDQRVLWTAVTGVRREGRRRTVVTVAAETSEGRVNLSIPLERDGRGFLPVAGYPALVGAPPVQRESTPAKGDEVEDGALVPIVERAMKNYLTGTTENLRADLTPDAVVSVPAQRLEVQDASDITWIERGRRIAVVVKASDPRASSWTLRYELEVQQSDRWYVRSIQRDPTLKGGGSG